MGKIWDALSKGLTTSGSGGSSSMPECWEEGNSHFWSYKGDEMVSHPNPRIEDYEVAVYRCSRCGEEKREGGPS